MRIAAALLIAFFATAPQRALADGAFPNAMQVLASSANPNELHLATTFGLVSSLDGGKSWSYVCEPYITGGTNVILYAREADGSLLALADKLWRTSDAGCTWTRVADASGTDGWSDLFIDPTSATRAFAISFVLNDGPRGLWESNDGAQTFSAPLATGVDGVVSVESSISNPAVVYVSSALYTGSGNPLLARSSDAGAHWSTTPVPVAVPSIVRILAVSSTDEDTLWLRATNVNSNVDSILISSDGGQSFTDLYDSASALTGFAHLADGTIYASDGSAGVLVNAPGTSGFVRRGTPHLLCLGQLGARLFGCGDSLKDGFNLASSDDEGASWNVLLSFPQISGPAACVQSQCASDWVYQQSQFAAASQSSGCSSGGDAGGLVLLGLALFWRKRRRLAAAAG